MIHEDQPTLLAQWLDSGGEPPEGLDADVVEAVLALRPDLAGEPRVTIQSILDGVTTGPFAPEDGAQVVAFPAPAAAVPEATAAGRPVPRVAVWAMLGGAGGMAALAAAAAIAIVLGTAPATQGPDLAFQQAHEADQPAAGKVAEEKRKEEPRQQDQSQAGSDAPTGEDTGDGDGRSRRPDPGEPEPETTVVAGWTESPADEPVRGLTDRRGAGALGATSTAAAPAQPASLDGVLAKDTKAARGPTTADEADQTGAGTEAHAFAPAPGRAAPAAPPAVTVPVMKAPPADLDFATATSTGRRAGPVGGEATRNLAEKGDREEQVQRETKESDPKVADDNVDRLSEVRDAEPAAQTTTLLESVQTRRRPRISVELGRKKSAEAAAQPSEARTDEGGVIAGAAAMEDAEAFDHEEVDAAKTAPPPPAESVDLDQLMRDAWPEDFASAEGELFEYRTTGSGAGADDKAKAKAETAPEVASLRAQLAANPKNTPRRAMWLWELGVALRMAGDDAGAIAAWREAIALNRARQAEPVRLERAMDAAEDPG